MRLLADRMVELGHVEALSYETVRLALKKLPQTSPQAPVGDPSEQECRLRVEDGAGPGSLYQEPYEPKRPVVCFDERPCQLIGDVRDPLPMKPGCIERFDSEYERGGVCWVFMSFEPLTGWRKLAVTERRRKQEFAHWMRRLAEDYYPQAEKIRVVLDNLSTHSGAAFYENFSAEVARELARRIEFVYTPVHG